MTPYNNPRSVDSDLTLKSCGRCIHHYCTRRKPRPLPAPPRLLVRWDRFTAPWMICVPDAFALPAKVSYRVFFLWYLDNALEILS